MHEVAESTTRALAHLVLPTTRLAEVGHGRQLGVDRLLIVPAVVHCNHGLLRILLVLELDVDITHKMITEVVTHVHLFDLAVLLLQLEKHVLEERIVVLLRLHVVHDVGSRARRCWGDAFGSLGFVLGVLEHVLEQEGL